MSLHVLDKMDKIIDQKAKISVITQMEILGWFGVTPDQLKLPNEFVTDATVLDLIPDIIN